ncbi:hypothetical protein HZA26_01110 [Candidatus Nomurabacteria bacterium]|nr:hypothetical protein [Candidatus Nomurabacteria bacterium]
MLFLYRLLVFNLLCNFTLAIANEYPSFEILFVDKNDLPLQLKSPRPQETLFIAHPGIYVRIEYFETKGTHQVRYERPSLFGPIEYSKSEPTVVYSKSRAKVFTSGLQSISFRGISRAWIGEPNVKIILDTYDAACGTARLSKQNRSDGIRTNIFEYQKNEHGHVAYRVHDILDSYIHEVNSYVNRSLLKLNNNNSYPTSVLTLSGKDKMFQASGDPIVFKINMTNDFLNQEILRQYNKDCTYEGVMSYSPFFERIPGELEMEE